VSDIEGKRKALQAIMLSAMIDECRKVADHDLHPWSECVEIVRLLDEASAMTCKRAMVVINESNP